MGALSVNTVLTNETEFLLIMMMKEKPTVSTLFNLARRIDQKVPHEPDYNFAIRPDVITGSLEIMREANPPMAIFVKVTSAKLWVNYLNITESLLERKMNCEPGLKN